MRFAHMADVHLGGWKEPRMNELSSKAFTKAIDTCLSEKVDFALIAGDLFNTSVPSIDVIKFAVVQLKRLKDAGVPTYLIAGSHDFSPSGKTMLDVLEEAELFVNVCKGEVVGEALRLRFTADKKTGAKITGMLGKKGMLDSKYYEKLLRENLESEKGFKIFMFHTALTELKTEELEKMESAPVSMLPKGFDYYAGGHVHIVKNLSFEGYDNVVYPGPVFPNSFTELEKLGHGSMYIYNDGVLRMVNLGIAETESIDVDAENKTPEEVVSQIVERLNKYLTGKLVLIRVGGTLSAGKASDVNFKHIMELAQEKGAYFVMKNTNKLKTKEYEEIKIQADSTEEAERLVVEENIGQITSLSLDPEKEKETINSLMIALNTEKQEGEKSTDYEERVLKAIENIIN